MHFQLTLPTCNSYIMGPSDLPDMYTQAQGLQAQGCGCAYLANHDVYHAG